jgi:hypothetical protein
MKEKGKIKHKTWEKKTLSSLCPSLSLNAKIEPILEQDPIDEVKVASLDDLIEPNLKDDTQFFIDEEEDKGSIDPKHLDGLLEMPKPSIELKPLPSGLRYAFLNSDQDSLMIISDKLS